MRFWRISNYKDLSGYGGTLQSSRWNHKGHRIVYLADHPSTSLLETLVHIEAEDAPPSYQLLAIDGADSLKIGEAALPDNWQEDEKVTQDIGSNFIVEGAFALLRIPSIVMPQASNYLLNPNHPDAASIRIVETWRYPFDSRLLA